MVEEHPGSKAASQPASGSHEALHEAIEAATALGFWLSAVARAMRPNCGENGLVLLERSMAEHRRLSNALRRLRSAQRASERPRH